MQGKRGRCGRLTFSGKGAAGNLAKAARGGGYRAVHCCYTIERNKQVAPRCGSSTL